MNALLSMREIAAQLGVPVNTLKTWVYRPSPARNFPRPSVIIARQSAGRRGYWTAAEVDAWRASHAA